MLGQEVKMFYLLEEMRTQTIIPKLTKRVINWKSFMHKTVDKCKRIGDKKERELDKIMHA
jgi:hypothetical protein